MIKYEKREKELSDRVVYFAQQVDRGYNMSEVIKNIDYKEREDLTKMVVEDLGDLML